MKSFHILKYFYIALKILYIYSSQSKNSHNNYYVNIQLDELVYIKIHIPRYSVKHSITLWMNHIDMSGLSKSSSSIKALLRYDGIPTLDIYDSMIEIPNLPKNITFIDDSPTQSILYIALYGGTLLNSLYYFAGNPTYRFIGIESDIILCANSLQHGSDCQMIDLMPITYQDSSNELINIFLILNQYKEYALFIPENLESFDFNLKSSDISIDLCNSLFTSKYEQYKLTIDFYLDQPLEENNAGRIVAIMDYKKMCSNIVIKPLVFSVPRPLSGIWTVRLFLSEEDQGTTTSISYEDDFHNNKLQWNSRSKQQMSRSLDITTRKNVLNVVLSIPIEMNVAFHSCKSSSTGYLPPCMADVITDEQCKSPIVFMNSLRTSSLINSDYVITSQSTKFPVSSNLIRYYSSLCKLPIPAPYIVFTTSLLPTFQDKLISQAFELELFITSKYFLDNKESINTYNQSIAFNTNQHLYVALRVGGLPNDPTSYPDISEVIDNSTFVWNVQSLNALLLSTRDASMIDKIEYDHITEANLTIIQTIRKYIWTIERPRIPNLHSGANGINTGSQLFLRVSKEIYASNENDDDDVITPTKTIIEEYASITLKIIPCNLKTCVHGNCYIKKGDINVATCQCKYPYAGEHCDIMSISKQLYINEIVLLVSSNLSMLPSVLLCISIGFYYLSILLASSAIASGLYHLCDMDVYCIADFSFHSLQVLDILLSVASISSVLFLYSPLSMNTQSYTAVSILCITTLLPLVTNDPTNPFNIIFGIILTSIIIFISWLQYYGLFHRLKLFLLDALGIYKNRIIINQYNLLLGHDSIENNDIELPFTSTIIVGNEMRSVYHYSNNSGTTTNKDYEHIDEHISQQQQGSRNNHHISKYNFFYYIRKMLYFIIGCLFSLLGFMCMIIQTRESYYYIHSLWHLFIMLSAYFLIRGYLLFAKFMKFKIYR